MVSIILKDIHYYTLNSCRHLWRTGEYFLRQKTWQNSLRAGIYSLTNANIRQPCCDSDRENYFETDDFEYDVGDADAEYLFCKEFFSHGQK
jgi:hypothetical protein